MAGGKAHSQATIRYLRGYLLVTFFLLVLAPVKAAIGDDIIPDDTFRLPEPEELEQALDEGLLTEDEYQRLLEISRKSSLSTADSLYVKQFPDLLTGIVSHPLLQETDRLDTSAIEEPTSSSELRLTGSCLYRQYNRMRGEEELRRLYRVETGFGDILLQGEIDQPYTGERRWTRRLLTCGSERGKTALFLQMGNFTEQFGLGAVYGYHGSLLSKSNQYDLNESFLFPRYGGTNGIEADLTINNQQIGVLIDQDRNDTYTKRFTGLSGGRKIRQVHMRLTTGVGSLRHRQTGGSSSAVYLSTFLQTGSRGSYTKNEGAVAFYRARPSVALITEEALKAQDVRFRVTGWYYDRHFPSWFSGGPSARRYRTLYLDAIDLAYRDRFAGEAGIALKVGWTASSLISCDGGLLYASRSDREYFLETKGRLTLKCSDHYRILLDCYEKQYGIYLEERLERRFQVQNRLTLRNISTGLVIGGRRDQSANETALVATNFRYRTRAATWEGSVKFDQIHLSKGLYDRAYASLALDTRLSERLHSHFRYSYRYKRDSGSGTYGLLRWDILWAW